MRRVLCAWLPQWPLQRLAAGRPELFERAAAGERTLRAVVLYRDRGGRAAQVAVASPRAAARGIRPGLPLAEALGLMEEERTGAAGRPRRAGRGEGREVGQARSAPVAGRGGGGGSRGTEETRQLVPGDLPAFAPPADAARAGSREVGLVVLPHSNLVVLQHSNLVVLQHGNLVVLQHDPAADRAALEDLAAWCGQFSPIVGLEEADEPECLLLDVTGLAPLFGGERRLAEHVLRALIRRGYVARLALADTVAAAWALARYGRGLRDEGRGREGVPPGATAVSTQGATAVSTQGATAVSAVRHPASIPHGSRAERRGGVPAQCSLPPARPTQPWHPALTIAPPGDALAALAGLPLAALRLADDARAWLRELGIERVEQLLALPRGGLAARFGPEVLRRVDEATGARATVIAPRRAPPVVEAAWEFETPTDRRDALCAALEHLLADVVGRLERRCQGVGEFECRLRPQAGGEEQFTVGLFRASGSARHLLELAELQLEQLTLAEPIAAVRVTVSAALPLEVRQGELGFEDETPPATTGGLTPPARRALAPTLHRGGVEGSRQLAALFDRLASRLGRGGVLRARLLADAQPEYACRWEPWIDPARRATGAAPRGTSRRVRGGTRSAARATGGLTPPARRRTATQRDAEAQPGFARRPLRLARRPAEVAVTSLAPAGRPARFVLRGREHRVRRCWGPERIETGWWRPTPVRRDYYRVESDRGGWHWLFRRRGDGRWFWHGAFE